MRVPANECRRAWIGVSETKALGIVHDLSGEAESKITTAATKIEHHAGIGVPRVEPSSVGGQKEASRRELAHPWGKGLLTAFTAS